jgi:hypothetical protein
VGIKMATYIEPFDFKTIFADLFIGSNQLFMFVFILIFSYVCAKFNMSNKIYLLLLGISALIFAGYMGQPMYILIVLIIGFISFKSIARLVT